MISLTLTCFARPWSGSQGSQFASNEQAAQQEYAKNGSKDPERPKRELTIPGHIPSDADAGNQCQAPKPVGPFGFDILLCSPKQGRLVPWFKQRQTGYSKESRDAGRACVLNLIGATTLCSDDLLGRSDGSLSTDHDV